MPEAALTALLRDRIRRDGPLPFVQFMDTALYHPGAGYYEHATIGRHGDFYTSASTGPLFGKLLAFQFSAWLEILPPGPVDLVEAGAHDGQLAADLLDWLVSHRPELCSRLRYILLEPSPTRQSWQQRPLEKFAGMVHWRREVAELGTEGIRGIFFSNELLDAFPVHRLGFDAKERSWFEWGVGWREDRFVWERLGPVSGGLIEEMELAGLVMPAELLAVLPDGFTVELSPTARRWWKTVAASLDRGWLLTLDYGLTAEDLFHPQRADGTLRAYYQHRLNPDALAHPGRQDLTAHINFTQLQRAGEQAGLRTGGLFSQTEFLTQIARQTWTTPSGFDEWTPAMSRQFQTLTHPNHLGRAFKVLVQECGPS
jgi:SAM-dependent MidA family methyltransferase